MGFMLPLPATKGPPPAPRDPGRMEPALLQGISALMERHTRYATRDLEQAKRHLRGLHDSICLSVEQPDAFMGYREVLLTMGNLMLTLGCIDARQGYELSFRSGDEYLVTIPLRGSGWAATGELFVEYGDGDIMIVAPSCSVTKHWDGPGEVFSLHVPAARFDQAVARVSPMGLPIAPIVTIGHRRLRSFLRLVDMICSDLQEADGSIFTREPLAAQLEDMLLMLLLENMIGSHPAAQAMPDLSPAVPYYVRRAENYIAANAHRDIGIEDIATAAGVSLRSIQYGFRRYRDSTPMLFLKHVRYHRARALLLAPDGVRRRICDIAAEIGCANLSQFSRDYRTLFGESPSDTLAAPRHMVM